jgi:hypothetical protein
MGDILAAMSQRLLQVGQQTEPHQQGVTQTVSGMPYAGYLT